MKKSDKSRAKLLRQFEQKQEVEYNKTVLDNGLRVISEKVPGVESFALGVCANFGSRDEPDSMPGIAHFLEHACFRRTKNRTAREIASQLESVGAYSNAFTTKELTCFYVRSLTKHFRKTLNILADISLNPVFQELDIKRERSVILEEIKSYEDDPEEYIFDLGDLYLFGENSFGNPILGTRDSIKKINAEVLEKYHSDRYSAANMVISAAGNIDHDRMVDNIHRHFGSLGRGKLHLREVPIRKNEPFREELNKPFSQGHLLLGRRIPGLESDLRYSIAILNVLWGDGMSSRLYQNIRERKGLAYTVYSNTQIYSDCGAFYVYAATDEKNTAKTEKAIIEEMRKFATKKISKSEFTRAREQIKSGLVMELESLSTRMQALAKNEFMLGRYENIRSAIEIIDEIKPGDIYALGEKFLDPSTWSSIIMLPD